MCLRESKLGGQRVCLQRGCRCGDPTASAGEQHRLCGRTHESRLRKRLAFPLHQNSRSQQHPSMQHANSQRKPPCLKIKCKTFTFRCIFVGCVSICTLSSTKQGISCCQNSVCMIISISLHCFHLV